MLICRERSTKSNLWKRWTQETDRVRTAKPHNLWLKSFSSIYFNGFLFVGTSLFSFGIIQSRSLWELRIHLVFFLSHDELARLSEWNVPSATKYRLNNENARFSRNYNNSTNIYQSYWVSVRSFEFAWMFFLKSLSFALNGHWNWSHS